MLQPIPFHRQQIEPLTAARDECVQLLNDGLRKRPGHRAHTLGTALRYRVAPCATVRAHDERSATPRLWCGLTDRRKDRAVADRRVVELVPWWTMGIGWLAALSHLAGDRAAAEALGRSLPPGRDAATCHAVAGNVDEMFEALEVAWRRRDAFLSRITREVIFEPYFGDSRFKSLLARMNLAV